MKSNTAVKDTGQIKACPGAIASTLFQQIRRTKLMQRLFSYTLQAIKSEVLPGSDPVIFQTKPGALLTVEYFYKMPPENFFTSLIQ